MKKLALLLILCAALGAGGYYYIRGQNSTLTFRTVAVRRGDLRSIIQATGTLNAEETVDVGTQISGSIKEIYVDYNDVVTEGQLIAEIESLTQQAEVDSAAADVQSARASLRKAEAELLKAQQDLRRSRQLAERDLIARSDLDADIALEASAQAEVAAAQAQVAQKEAELRKAQINLGYTKIYSPVDGVVVAKNVERGQTVAASYQTPSIAEIAKDLTLMQVEVDVDEADIGGVREGQQAEFTVDTYPGMTFYGMVSQVRLSSSSEDSDSSSSSSSASSNSVVTYTVIVKVDNAGQLLMPGMTANVSLILEDRQAVLLVPNSAFRFRPVAADVGQTMGPPSRRPTFAEAEDPAVYLLDRGQPVKVDVTRGITDGQSVEVVSGLIEGQQVIVGIEFPRED